MTATALPDPLAPLSIVAWMVDSDLVVNHVISGQDLSSQLDIKSDVSIALQHPVAAGLLRDALAGRIVRRRTLFDHTAVLLDAQLDSRYGDHTAARHNHRLD